MSRTSSIPTDRRTSSGVTPVSCLLLLGELLVSGRRRMNHQRLGIANVGHKREQLYRVDELLAGLEATLDAERDQRAWPLGRYFLARAW